MTPLDWFAAGMCSVIMALAWRRERFYRNFVRRRDIGRHAERILRQEAAPGPGGGADEADLHRR